MSLPVKLDKNFLTYTPLPPYLTFAKYFNLTDQLIQDTINKEMNFRQPQKTHETNPIIPSTSYASYSQSTIIEKLTLQKQKGFPLKIAFLDIDSTMTGDPSLTNKTRTKLEGAGYAVVFVTTRTEEMVMSEDSYQKSIRKYPFFRPAPHCAMDQKGKKHYIQPEKFVPTGLLDPDIIAGSTGTQIIVKQQDGGYTPDTGYEKTFGTSCTSWRKHMIAALAFLDPENALFTLSPIESRKNYLMNKTDVYPAKYRIILDCKSLQKKKQIQKRIRDAALDPKTPLPFRNVLTAIQITDDSNPIREKYTIYLTPKYADKKSAVERIVACLSEELQVKRETLELLIAGDSFPDLEMGLFGGLGTKTLFLLVGGSRLADAVLGEDTQDFAGETLDEVKNYLSEGDKGFYQFHAALPTSRSMIIADRAYLGKKAVESVFSFLTQHKTVIIEPAL